jgi:hypothetical protein
LGSTLGFPNSKAQTALPLCSIKTTLRKSLIAFLAIVAFVAPSVSAQTTWTATTGDWFDAANWSAGVPNSSTDAQIDNNGTA